MYYSNYLLLVSSHRSYYLFQAFAFIFSGSFDRLSEAHHRPSNSKIVHFVHENATASFGHELSNTGQQFRVCSFMVDELTSKQNVEFLFLAFHLSPIPVPKGEVLERLAVE